MIQTRNGEEGFWKILEAFTDLATQTLKQSEEFDSTL